MLNDISLGRTRSVWRSRTNVISAALIFAPLLAVDAMASATEAGPPPIAVVPAGFPSAMDTGVPLGTRLKVVQGDVSVDEPGTVLDGVDVQGCVAVKADDVVIRRSRITCGKTFVLRVYDGFRPLLVEDSTIDGAGTANVAVQGTNWTLRRVDISNSSDGVRMGSGTTLQDSYVHDLARQPESHNDTVQTIGGTRIRVLGNTLLPYKAGTDDPMNAAIQTGRLHTPLDDMLVEGNYMNGGGYTVRGGSGPRDRDLINNYVFRNNAFGHDCGFGPLNGVDSPVTFEPNNHWVDNTWRPLTNDAQRNRDGCRKRHRMAGSSEPQDTGSGGTAPSPTVRPTVEVVSRSEAGKRVTVNYTGSPGAMLLVYSKTQPATAYSVIGSVTLDRQGRGSSTHAPTRNTRVAAEATDGSGSGTPLVSIASVVSLRLEQQAGRTYLASGRVFPALRGRLVSLYQDGVLAGQGRSDASGTYRITRTLPRGTRTLETRTADDTYNSGARSAVRRVTVS